jgi:hypothetical protein
MKTMIFAAAALSLGMSAAAFANEGGPNSTRLPGVIAQAPAQNVPSIDTTHGQALRADTDRGPWLFPPIGKYLDQHAGG